MNPWFPVITLPGGQGEVCCLLHREPIRVATVMVYIVEKGDAELLAERKEILDRVTDIIVLQGKP